MLMVLLNGEISLSRHHRHVNGFVAGTEQRFFISNKYVRKTTTTNVGENSMSRYLRHVTGFVTGTEQRLYFQLSL